MFPRTLKSVAITEQMRAALGIDKSVEALTPAELIKACLRAPVDLLWNGGVGTYVKAITETNDDVGRQGQRRAARGRLRATRQVRGRGREPRLDPARPGRVRRAAAAGSTPTSSTTPPGSTRPTMRSTSRSCSSERWLPVGCRPDDRDELLASMTDEVAELVLADNYDQNLALANAVYHVGVDGGRARRLDGALGEPGPARSRDRVLAVDRG